MTKRSQNFLMMMTMLMTMLMKMLSGQHALSNLQKVATNKNMEDGAQIEPFHIWIRLSSLLHGDRSLGGCRDADKLLNGPTVASPLGFVIQNQS